VSVNTGADVSLDPDIAVTLVSLVVTVDGGHETAAVTDDTVECTGWTLVPSELDTYLDRSSAVAVDVLHH